MVESEHFVNPGYGWECKHCRAETGANATTNERVQPRFFSEGEAEDKNPVFSTPALARWRDATRQSMFCPACGIEERINKG